MYRRILVPLDGSPLTESVMPYVGEFARIFVPEEVVLLTVIERGDKRTFRKAEGYLRDQAGQLEKTWGMTIGTATGVRCITVRGPLGQTSGTILHFVEDNGMDLIMMSTHGRSGIDRWLMGSVAEKVLRGADIPVFLVRAIDGRPPISASLMRILVPLDGSELAEQVLPYVEKLARAASSQVVLLYVEPALEGDVAMAERSVLGPSVPRRKEAMLYLESIASSLRGTGVKAEPEVRAGHPPQQIVAEAEEGLVDLIIMASHGRTGLARWAFGSVADQVLHGSPVPVLLIRAPVTGTVPEHLKGPLVYRCHNCGRRIYREPFDPEDRCLRCQFFLKACGNCVHFNGAGCLLQLSYVADTYPGNRCPQFTFRKTRLILR